MNKTVIILGTARSGTSLLAGIVYKMGVELNPQFKEREDNKKGAFENNDFIALTSGITADVRKKMEKAEIIEKWESQIKSYIEKYKSNIWGWKSAVSHFCLDYFLPFMDNPYLITIMRNPLKNALSLKKHWRHIGLGSVSLITAIGHISESNAVLAGCLQKNRELPNLALSFEEIIREPIPNVLTIADFLEISLPEHRLCHILEFILGG